MFCDEQNLCGKHNITSGECAEVCRFIGVAILSSLHCSYTEFIALHCITIAVRLKFTIIRLPLWHNFLAKGFGQQTDLMTRFLLLGNFRKDSVLLCRRALQPTYKPITLLENQENTRKFFEVAFNTRDFLLYISPNCFPNVSVARLQNAPAKGSTQRKHCSYDKTQHEKDDEAKNHGNKMDEGRYLTWRGCSLSSFLCNIYELTIAVQRI